MANDQVDITFHRFVKQSIYCLYYNRLVQTRQQSDILDFVTKIRYLRMIRAVLWGLVFILCFW